MATKTGIQGYPRIQDESRSDYGCLDDSKLKQHTNKISTAKLKQMIRSAIKNANKKSAREILSIPLDSTETEVDRLLAREGKELFKYFKKYCGDPASTAHQVLGKNYRDVGIEQFRLKTLQRERMNSGWRYQFLAFDCASHSTRFKSVNDLGLAEADFNAVIPFKDDRESPLNFYVSVKNRGNTMGGQDWPKAIEALESVAKSDRNRSGFYCCIFGMAMDRGSRLIKKSNKKIAYSSNTEVWFSDFFWPFFANYAYEEIMSAVLEVLIATTESYDLPTMSDPPDKLLDSFGEECVEEKLLDELGNFNDAHKLVKFFCASPRRGRKW